MEYRKKATADSQKRFSEDIEELSKRLSKVEADQFLNMDSFMGGQLSKGKYLEHRDKLRAEAARIQVDIDALRKKQSEMQVIVDPKTEKAVQVMEKIRLGEEITNEQMKELIEEVRVFDTEHIEIRWKFPDEVVKFIEG